MHWLQVECQYYIKIVLFRFCGIGWNWVRIFYWFHCSCFLLLAEYNPDNLAEWMSCRSCNILSNYGKPLLQNFSLSVPLSLYIYDRAGTGRLSWAIFCLMFIPYLCFKYHKIVFIITYDMSTCLIYSVILFVAYFMVQQVSIVWCLFYQSSSKFKT